jgi:hypothetical protein
MAYEKTGHGQNRQLSEHFNLMRKAEPFWRLAQADGLCLDPPANAAPGPRARLISSVSRAQAWRHRSPFLGKRRIVEIEQRPISPAAAPFADGYRKAQPAPSQHDRRGDRTYNGDRVQRQTQRDKQHELERVGPVLRYLVCPSFVRLRSGDVA